MGRTVAGTLVMCEASVSLPRMPCGYSWSALDTAVTADADSLRHLLLSGAGQ